jgi:sugar lactone lactonase YvrE
MSRSTEVLLKDLCFGEGPRWHDDRLWFSDMHAGLVLSWSEADGLRTEAEVPGDPSGLGWLPDGRLLVVSMRDRRLLRRDATGLAEVADLSALATCHTNDMVVDAKGRAYIGNFGFDLHTGEDPIGAALVLVDPDGGTRVVADNLQFPNGMVITDDGRTLIVGETFGGCLTAFDVADDGSLTNRRNWATLDGAIPDGICLDAEGAIWVANPLGHELLRVREGGEVAETVTLTQLGFACMLGGSDGRTLFACTAGQSEPDACREERNGRIEMVTVEVPGAGRP